MKWQPYRSIAVYLLIGLLTQLAGCSLYSKKGAHKHPIFQSVDLPDAPPPDPEIVLRSREVRLDLTRLRDRTQRNITLPLFEDTQLEAVIQRREPAGDGGLMLYGQLEGQPGSSVMLSLVDQVVIGNIVTQAGEAYQVRFLGRNTHRIQQVDLSRYPPEAEPLEPTLSTGEFPTAADTCSTDPPTDIDVMVVYTAAARTGAGSTAAIEATIFLAVAETNQSYVNSNINQRIRLAHVAEVPYTESGNANTDLTRLQNPSDGFLDGVPTMRNQFAADATVLITESLTGCGIGYLMTTVTNGFEPFAYSVVRRSCATGNYSFGHELGHNMGARHDWVEDPTDNSPYHFNHGHLETSPTPGGVAPWRTIMSYNSSCVSTAGVGCNRLMYWSNPFVNFPPGGPPSDPTGTTAEPRPEDNRQTLNNTALTVANFRCSSPNADNVWMKDTWSDTGLEPDPATAGQEMWLSPYIWVRNTRDTQLTQQHQHQNPEFGSTNWAYVKLHNGGNTAASGNLELYFADASASLTWPAAWTLIGSTPVNSFAANSTRIVEQQWDNLPGTGHFCLLARWVSASDPFTFPEGTAIGTNVRNNNNLVWRNLNIVDLAGDEPSFEFFLVSNPLRRATTITLAVRGPREGRQPSFLRHGEVIVHLDEGLEAAWREGGSRGSGFEAAGNGLRIEPQGGRIENIELPPNFEGRVRLEFRQLPDTPQRSFGLDVVQLTREQESAEAPSGEKLHRIKEYKQAKKRRWHHRHAPETTVGGVSYEIHTDLPPRR